MKEKSMKLSDTVIEYGATKLQELLDLGYTASDFEQITEEPEIASCSLNKNGETVAILSFYGVKEKMGMAALAARTIDFACAAKAPQKSKDKKSPLQTFGKRLGISALIHLLSVGIFFCVYAVPPLFAWVQKTEVRAMGGSAALGMVLLVLPALVIIFLWDGAHVKSKPILSKVFLSIWFILNVAISVFYLVLIDNVFTHRFF